MILIYKNVFCHVWLFLLCITQNLKTRKQNEIFFEKEILTKIKIKNELYKNNSDEANKAALLHLKNSKSWFLTNVSELVASSADFADLI